MSDDERVYSEWVYRRDEDGEIRRGRFYHTGKVKPCLDCGEDAYDEFYMVQNHIWAQAVPEHKGWLCVTCLEARLGRRLQPGDFKTCPISMTYFRKTIRLMERMGGLHDQQI